jgi:hypothetical protein
MKFLKGTKGKKEDMLLTEEQLKDSKKISYHN